MLSGFSRRSRKSSVCAVAVHVSPCQSSPWRSCIHTAAPAPSVWAPVLPPSLGTVRGHSLPTGLWAGLASSTNLADLTIHSFCSPQPLPVCPVLTVFSMESPAQGQTELTKSMSGYKCVGNFSLSTRYIGTLGQFRSRCASFAMKGV